MGKRRARNCHLSHQRSLLSAEWLPPSPPGFLVISLSVPPIAPHSLHSQPASRPRQHTLLPCLSLPALCPRFICLCEQFGLSSTRCCCAWVWGRGQDTKWNHRSCLSEQTEGHMKFREFMCSPHLNLSPSLSQMCLPLAFAQAVPSAGKPSLSVVCHPSEAQCGSPHSSPCLPGSGWGGPIGVPPCVRAASLLLGVAVLRMCGWGTLVPEN